MTHFMRSQKEPTNAELADRYFPTYEFPYLLSSTDLMATEHSYIREGQKISKLTSKLIVSRDDDGKAPTAKELAADAGRALHILGNDTTDLADQFPDDSDKDKLVQALNDRIVGAFGNKAAYLLKHYDQMLPYYVHSPLLVSFLEFGVPIHRDDRTFLINIFQSEEGVPLIDASQKFISINIAKDRDFNSEPNNPRSKAHWKFKFDIKVLARATPKGFEVIGLGTDSPVVAGMYLGDNHAALLFQELIQTILDIQQEAKAAKEKLLVKMEKAHTKFADNVEDEAAVKSQKNIQSKITLMTQVLEKINSFKKGEITFDKLVNLISDSYQVTKNIEPRGVLRKYGKDSGTTTILKSFADRLTTLKEGMDATAAKASRKYKEDTSKEVFFKGKLNEVKNVIKDYKEDTSRLKNLGLLARKFDSSRGAFRAVAYISLLEQTETPLGQAIVVSAILNGKGTQLKKMITDSFDGIDEKAIKEKLNTLINTSVQSDYLQKTVAELITNISEKADSNKPVDFKNELEAMAALESSHRAGPRMSY